MSPGEFGGSPDLERVMLEHEYRGVRLQIYLRAALVLFVGLTLFIVPPARSDGICLGLLAVYAMWAGALAWWSARGGRGPVDAIWLALFVDLAIIAGLTLLTGLEAEQSWTADILTNGLFVIPLLACTQLRPLICASVVASTVVVFFAASWATKTSNDEPWSSILLSTLALAVLCAGAVFFTAIQRSRVRTIGQLVHGRTVLLAEVMTVEQRERRTLSEQLHDGVLQYVLAARLDLDDIVDGAGPEAVARIAHALNESSRLLRATVAELHPAVLEHVGLAAAIGDLGTTTQSRGGLDVEIRTSEWTGEAHTPVDGLLFGVARELLSNVVKHADASNVRVELAKIGRLAVLEIADNGRGITADALDRSRKGGHIGLVCHELRVIEAGGTFSIRPGPGSGTVARIEVPLAPEQSAVSVQ